MPDSLHSSDSLCQTFAPTVGQPAMALKLQQLLLGQIDESELNGAGAEAQDMHVNGGLDRRAWTPWSYIQELPLFAA